MQVGIADAIPKPLTSLLLQPVLAMKERVVLACIEGPPERLLESLSSHEVDVVFADAPCTAHPTIKVLSHLLVRCPVVIMGTKAHARRFRKGFPLSLRGAPLLLPTPQIMGEFDDQALLVEMGHAGLGLFPIPAAIEKTICSRFPVHRIGVISEIHESFYALTAERRVSPSHGSQPSNAPAPARHKASVCQNRKHLNTTLADLSSASQSLGGSP